VNCLLEDRFEAGEVLRRTAQRNWIDKPISTLDQRHGLDAFSVLGFLVQTDADDLGVAAVEEKPGALQGLREVKERRGEHDLGRAIERWCVASFCGGTSMRQP